MEPLRLAKWLCDSGQQFFGRVEWAKPPGNNVPVRADLDLKAIRKIADFARQVSVAIRQEMIALIA